MAMMKLLMRGSDYGLKHKDVERPELHFIQQLRKQKVRSFFALSSSDSSSLLQAAKLAALDLAMFSKKEIGRAHV